MCRLAAGEREHASVASDATPARRTVHLCQQLDLLWAFSLMKDLPNGCTRAGHAHR
jgi:hypothetical protein